MPVRIIYTRRCVRGRVRNRKLGASRTGNRRTENRDKRAKRGSSKNGADEKGCVRMVSVN